MLPGVLLTSLLTALPVTAQAPGGGKPAVIVAPARMEKAGGETVFTGRIRSPEKVEIIARVEGFLGPRQVEDGADVKKGDLLFVIKPDRYEAVVAQAGAAAASAKASLALAQLSFDRTQTLVSRNTSSEAQLDDARANLQKAKASVAAEEAALQLAEIDLSYTEIAAPITGRISAAAFTEGALVSTSSGPIAVIVAQDPMRVNFAGTQKQYLQVRRQNLKPDDMVLRLRLADGSLYDHVGQILFPSVSAQEGTDSIEITAEIPNPDALLVDGQLVEVLIGPKTPEMRLVIPQVALMLDQQGSYVLTVDDAGKVQIRRISVGDQNGTSIAVTGGLEEGENVIVSGLQKIQPGVEVTTQAADAAGGN